MPQSFVRFPPLFACAAIVAGVSVPTKLLAQDRPRGEWDVTLGAGAAVRPTYEGSDHYIASPVPFVNVIWRDTISLGVDGLSAYWRYENLRVGGGLTYATGRYQSSGIFQQGDNSARRVRARGIAAVLSHKQAPAFVKRECDRIDDRGFGLHCSRNITSPHNVLGLQRCQGSRKICHTDSFVNAFSPCCVATLSLRRGSRCAARRVSLTHIELQRGCGLLYFRRFWGMLGRWGSDWHALLE